MCDKTNKEVIEYYLRQWEEIGKKYVLNRDFCYETMCKYYRLGKMIKVANEVAQIAKEVCASEHTKTGPGQGHYGEKKS